MESVNTKHSSVCIMYGSDKVAKRGRLFKCLSCGLKAHRDVVGVLSMANLHGGGTAIGVVAHPLPPRWNGMKWKPRRAMNTRNMKILGA